MKVKLAGYFELKENRLYSDLSMRVWKMTYSQLRVRNEVIVVVKAANGDVTVTFVVNAEPFHVNKPYVRPDLLSNGRGK